ncbi:MAG: hypothetical protein EPO07_03625 [Verrucomicrobia bacterium]|nr:MAG: hypothetical protein EPO07_03625 [Verrucomicrobiota bacterium]
MKTTRIIHPSKWLVIAGVLAALAVCPTQAQTAVDGVEVARATIKADRKTVIAENMQLSETEGKAFWPLYREYRHDMEKANDELVKLVLEYADLFPNVPEDRAKDMLKRYTKMESQLVTLRVKHLKKIGTVLPATKTLRFAQLENRLDLAVRLGMAASIPLVPPTPKP